MNSTQDFVEQMGLLTERAGLPRIAGRLLGYLLLEGRAHALDELAAQLQVSKASISTNTRLLEHRGLIARVAHPGDRRDYYRIVDEPWERVFDIVSEQLRDTHRLLADALTTLALDDEAARRRLEAWSSFYAFLLEDLETKVSRWRERHSG